MDQGWKRGRSPVGSIRFSQDSSGTDEEPDQNEDLDKTEPSKDLRRDPGPNEDKTERLPLDQHKDSDQVQDHNGPSTPQRPQKPHRPLAQSASYQPGDSLRYRLHWLQDSESVLNLDSDLDQDQQEYRIVLIGDQAVGKSSLAAVFAETTDRDQEESRDSFERTLTVDGEDMTLKVLDTWDSHHSGACLEGAAAYIIVYSVTDRSSFEAAAELRITLRRATQREHLPIIIVGNKSDLVRAREVTTQEGLACAVVFDCKFIETSASLNVNVLELFEGAVRQIRLHRDTSANTLTPHRSPRRKQSLTERARRLLDRLVSRGNHRVSLRARSKSCHDLAVL